MKFKTFLCADVSTAELEESDLLLLNKGNLYCVAEYLYGAYFYTVIGDWPEKEFADAIKDLRDHGFSQKFIDIWREAGRQGIPYICFDADGEEIEHTDSTPTPALRITEPPREIRRRVRNITDQDEENL